MTQPVTIIMVEDDEGHARLIERDDVDVAPADALEAFLAAQGMNHLVAAARQATLDDVRQRVVVIDVKQRRRGLAHVAAAGTWMTEKNSPSWRMALPKFS